VIHPSSGPQAEFAKAWGFYQHGRLADAEQVCRAILAGEPGHFEAAHLLGVIFLQRCAFENAERQIGLAIAINPASPWAHNNRGNALQHLKRMDEALASFERAIALKPDHVVALNNRGNALKELGRPAEALASYDRAIALKPDYAEAHNNRGNALQALDRYAEALPSYNKAIALKPDYAEAFNNRGNALRELGRRDEAVGDFDRALALAPDYAEAFNNRGIALQGLKRHSEALASYDKAIALKPDSASAHANRAVALQALGRFAEALASFDSALALKPDFADALYNRGRLKLLLSDAAGWAECESRWKTRDLRNLRPPLDRPTWTGESLDGRSILVYGEQGLGDIIQFARYVPMLAGKAADVGFYVTAKLVRILESLPGRVRLLPSIGADKGFDY
jgi:tetratricopeptide (TPR) repeat protein